MIPDNELSTPALPGPYQWKMRSRAAPLVDFERGGVALNDPSQGLDVRTWRCFYAGAEVRIAPDEEGAAYTAAFAMPGITALGLAFDQNMRPFIAYETASEAGYWWFDTAAGAQVFSVLPAGSTDVVCCLDDRRSMQLAMSDILLAYVRDNTLYYRQQRDRFLTERALYTPVNGRLTAVGMNTGLRIQFRILPS